MSVTPEFGWPLIEPTDLVTNLPADFESFADTVDDDLKGLLGGGAGQVLTKDSATDLDFSWAAPTGGGETWTLLNAGGTALTGATTITVSGISDQKRLMIVVDQASSVNASSGMRLLINSTTTNYINSRVFIIRKTTYDVMDTSASLQTNGIELGGMSNNADSKVWASCLINGANTAGVKPFQGWGSGTTYGGNSFRIDWSGGVWNNTDLITSISLVSGNGNFDEGTLYVYGAV